MFVSLTYRRIPTRVRHVKYLKTRGHCQKIISLLPRGEESRDRRSLAGESRETMQPVSAIQCLITLSRPLIHVRRNSEYSLTLYTGAEKLS